MTNPSSHAPKHALATDVWTLWIDSVGGFRLLEGEQFTIGGPGGEAPADIAVRSAWGRHTATLSRVDDDIWFQQAVIRSGMETETSPRPAVFDEPLLIDGPEHAKLMNEPSLKLKKPSPLSGTIVVTLDPPHRFVLPIDAFMLFDKTLLIGPERSNHIQSPRMTTGGLVMTKRANQWSIRRKDGTREAMNDGERVEIDDLVMTIRREASAQIGEKR